MQNKFLLFILLLVCVACRQPVDKRSMEHVPIVDINANMQLMADSVVLLELPLTDTLILYKNARVAVVEHNLVVAEDSTEVCWVKVAHNQKLQGWLKQADLEESFVPVHYISQAIYAFSRTYMPYSVVCVSLFVILFLYRTYRKKKIWLVYVNDIDSVYPLLFCFLVGLSATLYESVQLFDPDAWQQFFFKPTLSPFQPSVWVTSFLLSLWAIVLVGLATLDVVFRRLSLSEALFYLLGLLAAAICGYLFFVFATRIYVGYLFLLIAFYLFIQKVRAVSIYSYYCGNCAKRIRTKGQCPHCGAINR